MPAPHHSLPNLYANSEEEKGEGTALIIGRGFGRRFEFGEQECVPRCCYCRYEGRPPDHLRPAARLQRIKYMTVGARTRTLNLLHLRRMKICMYSRVVQGHARRDAAACKDEANVNTPAARAAEPVMVQRVPSTGCPKDRHPDGRILPPRKVGCQ